jgi:hypothetical protein
VVKTAERTGVRPGLAVWRREPMLRTGESSRSWAAMKIAGAVTEVVAHYMTYELLRILLPQ